MHILDLNFLDLSSNNRNNENENKKMDNCADFDFLDLS